MMLGADLIRLARATKRFRMPSVPKSEIYAGITRRSISRTRHGRGAARKRRSQPACEPGIGGGLPKMASSSSGLQTHLPRLRLDETEHSARSYLLRVSSAPIELVRPLERSKHFRDDIWATCSFRQRGRRGVPAGSPIPSSGSSVGLLRSSSNGRSGGRPRSPERPVVRVRSRRKSSSSGASP